MKSAVSILLLALALSCTASAYSFDENTPLTDKQLSTIRVSIEKNLVDPSIDIRCSTVQLIMELKEAYPKQDFDYAIIPLISVLKNEECAELRILAARTLFMFDSELAHFAVARRALYDPSDRVARHCGTLARSWGLKANTQEFVASTN